MGQIRFPGGGSPKQKQNITTPGSTLLQYVVNLAGKHLSWSTCRVKILSYPERAIKDMHGQTSATAGEDLFFPSQ